MRQEDNFDILQKAIGAMILATVPGAHSVAEGYIVRTEDMKFDLRRMGRYSWNTTGIRVTGDSMKPHDERKPFFIAKTVEEAKEKLTGKLIPNIQALAARIDAKNARRKEADTVRKNDREAAFAQFAAAGLTPKMDGESLAITTSTIIIKLDWYRGYARVSYEPAFAHAADARAVIALAQLLSRCD